MQPPSATSTLRSLRLRSNRIDANGAVALLACAMLQHLSLFDNPLGPCDLALGSELSLSVARSREMRELDLGACRLEEVSLTCAVLASCARANAQSFSRVRLRL